MKVNVRMGERQGIEDKGDDERVHTNVMTGEVEDKVSDGNDRRNVGYI